MYSDSFTSLYKQNITSILFIDKCVIDIYSVTCLNWIALGPNFSASLDRDPDYKG